MIDIPRATHNKDIVYDIGINKGQDTANYLAKGFNVVAIEANPQLVDYCADRFQAEIGMGRLAIIHGAVVREGMCDTQDGTVTFFLNSNDAWGTVISDTSIQSGERGAEKAQTIVVPTLDLKDVFNEYGMPYYLKTDIEGADIACLEALRDMDEVPAYVSLESDVDSFENVRRELSLLGELGYTAFQIINQKDIKDILAPGSILEYGGSGDFGPWLPADGWIDDRSATKKYRELFIWYKLFSRRGLLRNTPLQKPLTNMLSNIRGYTIPSWHDTHARHQDIV